MTDQQAGIYRRLNLHTVILVILVFAVLIVSGRTLFRGALAQLHTLSLYWSGDELHAYSAKDGPYVVTHLFQPGSSSQQRSVAQLSNPVTIIDSSGHYFTYEEIQALTWVGSSGDTISPPAVGAEIKALYWIPRQTDRASQ